MVLCIPGFIMHHKHLYLFLKMYVYIAPIITTLLWIGEGWAPVKYTFTAYHGLNSLLLGNCNI